MTPTVNQLVENEWQPENTLYLIDISAFIFRAYHAIRMLTSPSGLPVNSIYGVTTMLTKTIEQVKPKHLLVLYDSKEPTFREDIYAEYKANRSAPPDELVPQFEWIEKVVSAMKIPSVRRAGVEADDLIATYVKRWLSASSKNKAVVLTGDKDLSALIAPGRVWLWDTMGEKVFGTEEVIEKFGVRPDQICDFLALCGDAVDNIPGVPGIGKKTAADLLATYGTLEGCIEAAHRGDIPKKMKGDALREHEASARLSRVLATLKDDCESNLELEKLSFVYSLEAPFRDLLTELGFHSLVKKWFVAAGDATAFAVNPTPSVSTGLGDVERATLPVPTWQTLTSMAEINRFLHECEQVGGVAFDLETTSLNPIEAEIVGISMCHNAESAIYIPIGHDEARPVDRDEVLERLKTFIESGKVRLVGQNLKYDLSVLEKYSIYGARIEADTMVAAYVLDPTGKHGIDFLADKYFGYKTLTFKDVCGTGKNQIPFSAVPIETATRYAAEDAWITYSLWEYLRPKLEAEDHLMQVFKTLDLPLVPVLQTMEMNGILIDIPYLAGLSTEFEADLKRIEKAIGADINLNSPKQVAKLLFEDLKLPPQGKTQTGFSTDASVLAILAELHEIPRLMLEYREVSKLKSTYVDSLPTMVDAKTGRVHTSFHQTGTATGRLSSSDPNLQNIPIRSPRGERIRKAFIAPKGRKLISADYSQIELRILAEMSGDPQLLDSFQRGEDIHRRTASEIFGIPPGEVDDRQRSVAKAINFGLIYGKSVFGLAAELRISRVEAKDMIERYFGRYTHVKKFLDQLIVDARERLGTVTRFGRKRKLPDIVSKNHAVRANAERMAMNTPLQGTAADLMRLAMIHLHQTLKDGGWTDKGVQFLLQVHDEVILECDEVHAEAVARLVRDTLEKAVTWKVPLVASVAIGNDWMEL